MMNKLFILAGIATLGAFLGATQPKAEAASITLADTVITSAVPSNACTEFTINPDDSADCFDGDIVGTYSVDNYAIESDTDGNGFYLLVWK